MTGAAPGSRVGRRVAVGAALIVVVAAAAGWVWAIPTALERTVRGYLLEHPEVIVDAVNVLRMREDAEEAERQHAVLAERAEALRYGPESPVGGNPDGDVTLVEFYDYKCPYCRQFYQQLIAVLAADPNVRVVFKEYPILGPESDVASRAALAAHDQGPEQFWALHRALMTAPGILDQDAVLQIAAEIGLDVDRLAIDMAQPSIDRRIRENRELAAAIGIRGTPELVIGDAIVPGYVDADEVLRLIAAAREDCVTCASDARKPL